MHIAYWVYQASSMGMILDSGGNLKKMTSFKGRFLYYTILSNNLDPNKIVKNTTTRKHPQNWYEPFWQPLQPRRSNLTDWKNQ